MGAMTGEQAGQYDTRLSPTEESAFQHWRATLPPNLQNMGDYDLRGAWKANAQQAANGHLPDTFKKPNHVTFSDGSIYADDHNPAGSWVQRPDGTWLYFASPSMTRYRDPSDLLNYFQAYEQGNGVVLPAGVR
jgi:hypothetical protein